VWFAGVHCDVGGGYPEEESGLAKLALEWMLDEASAPHIGLLVDPAERARVLGQSGGAHVPPDPHADAHESLHGAWVLAEFVPKRHFDFKTGKERHRMNLFRRRTIPEGSMVHWSVRERGEDYAARLPKTATTFAKASQAEPT
jgi:hypothetical protein